MPSANPRGRPRQYHAWQSTVAMLMERDGPPLKAREITEALQRMAIDRGRPAPSEATVRRLMVIHAALPEPERHFEARFNWPQSMMDGVLPWEAAPICFELVRQCLADGRKVPGNRLVRWYYRLRMVAPDVPAAVLTEVAVKLAVWELTGRQPQLPELGIAGVADVTVFLAKGGYHDAV